MAAGGTMASSFSGGTTIRGAPAGFVPAHSWSTASGWLDGAMRDFPPGQGVIAPAI